MPNLTDLKLRLNSGAADCCYLLSGEDGYMRNQAYAAIKASLKLSYEELNLSVFFEDAVDTGELISACQSLPFLSEKRLVAVKEYYPKADEAARLDREFLTRENDTAVLVVMNAKSSECFKKIKDRLYQVDCGHPELTDAVKWIGKKFSLAGSSILPGDARLIAEYCLSDMSRISVECEKLISYTAGCERVGKEDIDAVVVKESEYQIYEMSGAIAAKDKTRAYRILESLLAGKQSEQLLLMSLYSHYRRMLFARIGKTDVATLAEQLGVKEYAVKKAGEQAKLFQPKALKAALDTIAEADYLAKSGKIAAAFALKNVVLKLINA